MSQIQDNELRFLAPSKTSVRKRGKRKPLRITSIITLLFMAFIVWASQSELQQSIKASAEIKRESSVQSINNQEGGIIKEILVKNDQLVRPGQVLMRLDTTTVQAKSSEDNYNYYQQLATVERLSAEAENKKSLNFSHDFKQYAPDIVRNELSLFKVNQTNKRLELDNAKEEITIKQAELTGERANLYSLRDQYNDVVEKYNIHKHLSKDWTVSRIQLLDAKIPLTDLKGKIRSSHSKIKGLKASIRQAKNKIKDISARRHGETVQNLDAAKIKLREYQSKVTVGQDVLNRKEIISPVLGKVREIKTRTVGSFVQPSEPLIDIVPETDNLVIYADVSPADIGKLRSGLLATVKITAYDNSIYGSLEAIVHSVSPDTIADKNGHQGQKNFRVTLYAKTNALMKDGKAYPIKTGMSAEVDIQTGHKTVLGYLLKPVLKTFSNSLTES